MTIRTTTLKAQARTQFFGMPACPRCGESVLAPTASVLVNCEAIHHHWSCEACACDFATVIRLSPRRPHGFAHEPPRTHAGEALCCAEA